MLFQYRRLFRPNKFVLLYHKVKCSVLVRKMNIHSKRSCMYCMNVCLICSVRFFNRLTEFNKFMKNIIFCGQRYIYCVEWAEKYLRKDCKHAATFLSTITFLLPKKQKKKELQFFRRASTGEMQHFHERGQTIYVQQRIFHVEKKTVQFLFFF